MQWIYYLELDTGAKDESDLPGSSRVTLERMLTFT